MRKVRRLQTMTHTAGKIGNVSIGPPDGGKAGSAQWHEGLA